MGKETQKMNCRDCEAYREDLQTEDDYCKEMAALIMPGAVKCPRQQAQNSFREHIIGRFNRAE